MRETVVFLANRFVVVSFCSVPHRSNARHTPTVLNNIEFYERNRAMLRKLAMHKTGKEYSDAKNDAMRLHVGALIRSERWRFVIDFLFTSLCIF